ncbi:uncharacterized protein LOC131166475 [Malania oleifera]|uniref:uncharacterized protein LOC131166475 n=1 Tax=Malania oleifera TaxID=397392 RepID=UPI0025AECA06|nr:uncharacterized protein LOC131166475 [Malania oleifera]
MLRLGLKKQAAVRALQRGGRCLCIKPSRVVMSFGDGSHGALGLLSVAGLGGDAYEPTPVPGLPCDVSSVTAGHYHSLAVTAKGEVWAWGRNNEAQLGRGLLAPRDSWSEAKKVEGLDQIEVKAAFASGVISTVVGGDGSLWVWGKSKHGQLGLGKDVTEAIVPSRVEALAAEKIVKVSLGWGHALALTEDGKLFGWGYSADGRLGQIGRGSEMSSSPSADSYTVTQVSSSSLEVAENLVLEAIEKEKNLPITWEPSLLEELCGVEVVDVACGLDHSLVLCSDGALLSCGSNVYGQLGRESQGLGMLPVEISFRPLAVASGLGHSFAICRVGSSEAIEDSISILSWGWNGSSQLGRAGRDNRPLVVDGLAGERPVSVSGGRVHSIALTSKGEVWTWGCGKDGRLGLGSSANEVEPSLLDCLEDVEVLQAVSGFDHNLILTSE